MVPGRALQLVGEMPPEALCFCGCRKTCFFSHAAIEHGINLSYEIGFYLSTRGVGVPPFKTSSRLCLTDSLRAFFFSFLRSKENSKRSLKKLSLNQTLSQIMEHEDSKQARARPSPSPSPAFGPFATSASSSSVPANAAAAAELSRYSSSAYTMRSTSPPSASSSDEDDLSMSSDDNVDATGPPRMDAASASAVAGPRGMDAAAAAARPIDLLFVEKRPEKSSSRSRSWLPRMFRVDRSAQVLCNINDCLGN